MDAEGYRDLFEELGIYTWAEIGRRAPRAELTKVLRLHDQSLGLYFDRDSQIGVYFTGRR